MNKDINNLSGIEFEALCQQLLQKVGFNVETTKASGDGGIDLIAFSHAPFFSGKYIIQCKRYAGSVGEPVIRDLYGVVMAERANKGILITTGHFTLSAIEFAKDKNIELIDGTKLQELLHQYEGVEATVKDVFFFDHDNFDKPKYLFYKDIVSQADCTEEMAFDYLHFLFSYLVNTDEPSINLSGRDDCDKKMHFRDVNNYDLSNATVSHLDLVNNGLVDEFIHYFEWYINRYYKKGKLQLQKRPLLIYKYGGIADIYAFNLFSYVQERYNLLNEKNIGLSVVFENQPYYRGDYIEYYAIKKNIDQMLENPHSLFFGKKYYYYELMNLYSLFNYLGIEQGKKKIIELASRSPMNEELHIEEDKLFSLYSKERTFELMLNNKKFLILHPMIGESYDINSRGKRVFSKYNAHYKFVTDFTDYYEKYASANNEKIQREIMKIRMLLET